MDETGTGDPSAAEVEPLEVRQRGQVDETGIGDPCAAKVEPFEVPESA
jgi:hypothetical protein